MSRRLAEASAARRAALNERSRIAARSRRRPELSTLWAYRPNPNPNGIVRRTSRRVTRYRDADMALRWTAAGFIKAHESFRKIQGSKEL